MYFRRLPQGGAGEQRKLWPVVLGEPAPLVIKDDKAGEKLQGVHLKFKHLPLRGNSIRLSLPPVLGSYNKNFPHLTWFSRPARSASFPLMSV